MEVKLIAGTEALDVSGYTVRKIEKGAFLPSRELDADLGEVFNEPQTAMAAAGYIPFVGWKP